MSKIDNLRVKKLSTKGKLAYWRAYQQLEASNWLSKWYAQVQINKLETKIDKLDKKINKLK